MDGLFPKAALVVDRQPDCAEEQQGVSTARAAPSTRRQLLDDGVGDGRDDSGGTSMPWSSARWSRIDLALIPRAYIDTISSSNSGQRRWYLAISCEANGAARSPEMSSRTLDVPVGPIFGLVPRRRFVKRVGGSDIALASRAPAEARPARCSERAPTAPPSNCPGAHYGRRPRTGRPSGSRSSMSMSMAMRRSSSIRLHLIPAQDSRRSPAYRISYKLMFSNSNSRSLALYPAPALPPATPRPARARPSPARRLRAPAPAPAAPVCRPGPPRLRAPPARDPSPPPP